MEQRGAVTFKNVVTATVTVSGVTPSVRYAGGCSSQRLMGSRPQRTTTIHNSLTALFPLTFRVDGMTVVYGVSYNLIGVNLSRSV